MEKNVGSGDQMIRVFVAAIILILYSGKIISGTLGVILLIFSAVFVITSLVSVCPFYKLFKLNSRKISQSQKKC